MDTADNPPVDLLVRSSGVYRFSDFLLWQCHQDTQIQVMDTLWPDFGTWELFMVLLKWQRVKTATRSRPATARSQVVSSSISIALPLLLSFLSAVSYYFLTV
jgi:ditrans,polycis-polyprenyl diphosphate synthase